MLSPAVNLESLTIDGNLTWTVGSFLNLNLLAYLHLATPSLRHIVWEDSSAIHRIIPVEENLVVQHRKTLKKLKLCSCAIAIPEGKDIPYCFWATVWK